MNRVPVSLGDRRVPEGDRRSRGRCGAARTWTRMPTAASTARWPCTIRIARETTRRGGAAHARSPFALHPRR